MKLLLALIYSLLSLIGGDHYRSSEAIPGPLIDYRNRSFDPATGRFLQRDPVLDESNLFNPYAGMGNNPVGNVDPMGLFTMQGMYEAFFEEYGMEAVSLLLWADKQGLRFKKRGYWAHDWYYEGGNTIGIKATNLGTERSNENAAAQLHEAILEMYNQRVTERKVAANFRDAYGEAGGASFWLYYVGREVGFTYTAEAIAGGDAAGNDWTAGQRWLAGSVGMVQSVLTLAPVGSGVVAGGGKLLGRRAAARLGASFVGKLLARDVTLGAGQLIRRTLMRAIGRTIGRRFGSHALAAFKKKVLGRAGKLIGSLKGAEPHERKLIAELLEAGTKVEVIPVSAKHGKTSMDVFLNGVRTEIKQASTWSAVKNQLTAAGRKLMREGDEVLIDARAVRGLSPSMILERIGKATSYRKVLGKRTITVLFEQGTLVRTGQSWVWTPVAVGAGQAINAGGKGK